MPPRMAHELNDADEQILGHLIRGRNLPQNLADELDYSRQYVQNRLQMLKAADYVTNLGGGLYELTEDGRDEIGAGAESRDELRDQMHEWKNRWHNTHSELEYRENQLDELRAALADARDTIEQVNGDEVEDALDRMEEILDGE